MHVCVCVNITFCVYVHEDITKIYIKTHIIDVIILYTI